MPQRGLTTVHHSDEQSKENNTWNPQLLEIDWSFFWL